MGNLGGSSLNKIPCWGEPETWLRSLAPRLLTERPKPLALSFLICTRDVAWGPWVAEERMYVKWLHRACPRDRGGTREGQRRDTGGTRVGGEGPV